MAIGLLLGVVLVVMSIAGTRYWCARLRPRASDARRLEVTAWAVSLVAAALIYVGFALREAGEGWMRLELVGVVFYSAFAWAGRRRGWVVALGWALHAAWDVLVHHDAPEGLVPQWYRWACLSYDVVAALYLLRRTGSKENGGVDP